ncbi:MAG TPA: ATP-binding cassette domain-containing protein [Segeticoccus sp.]|uniref:ABC transporter ATP-binding protein n=1 Tax=Segeticoccus sp. TaxID=2706531 RepID=UPI002D7FA39E|nr:ATP-binding cassette domain-containing protein [Segeticoccus sp.]HET8599346.1 ATP-binding cassette domain-containing protein [Segeticoccus sp.]
MIEVKGLTKKFGATLAVDHLSFDVQPGVVTGFLGPNGAGKSTTMRMILGLDRPTAGEALVNGVPYAKMRTPLRQVGALLDAKDVHGGRSARAHLLALAQSNGLPRSRVGEVVELTGLTDVAKRRVKEFSLGMSQRLGIAAALLGDPGVLMFDEPVNGLDPEGILWIRTFMQYLAGQGRTVLVSSHLMSEMALTADHLVVIGRGRLLADTSTKAFIDEHSKGHVRVRVSEPDRLGEALRSRGVTAEQVDGYLQVTGLSTDEVGHLALQQQVAVLELFEQKSSLEAAFMEMTRGSVEYHAGAPGEAEQQQALEQEQEQEQEQGA